MRAHDTIERKQRRLQRRKGFAAGLLDSLDGVGVQPLQELMDDRVLFAQPLDDAPQPVTALAENGEDAFVLDLVM